MVVPLSGSFTHQIALEQDSEPQKPSWRCASAVWMYVDVDLSGRAVWVVKDEEKCYWCIFFSSPHPAEQRSWCRSWFRLWFLQTKEEIQPLVQEHRWHIAQYKLLVATEKSPQGNKGWTVKPLFCVFLDCSIGKTWFLCCFFNVKILSCI